MSMKLRLLVGVAVPFAVSCVAQAYAQEVTTPLTDPIRTSTANSGQPANISITSAGSVTLTGRDGETAVTVDSSNTLANAGSITVNNSNNAVGVRILPGLTTGYSGTGSILVLEDYTRTDTDNDGDLDGPLATGTGRFGLLLEAGAPMVGSITFGAGSRVEVEGNESAAVSLRSAIDGSFRQSGTTSLIGSNGFGVDMRGDISGDVAINGFVSAQGENSVGLRSLGAVGGEFMVGGTITATGFTSTTISNYVDPDVLPPGQPTIAERRDADDLLIGGPALRIAGNLARGLLLNGAATGGVDTTPDVKDAIQNFNENRTEATITAFGSSPAVLIQGLDGAASGLVLSRVRESVRDTLDDDRDGNFDEIIGTFNYDYGLVHRGLISANGLNVGFRATGLDVRGSADGLNTTTIEGGLFAGGQVIARAFEADSRAIVFGARGTTPRIDIAGVIQSTVFTETDHTAYGVLLESGAQVPAINVTGSITATTRGYDGSIFGIRDRSGTLTSIANSGRISAQFTDDDLTDDITSGAGRAIAIDVSANTSGVTLTQSDSRGDARIIGDVLFGSGADRFDLASGEVQGAVAFGMGADVLNIGAATLTGDVSFLGAGSQTTISGGTLNGALAFGGAGSSLSLTNRATYSGYLSSGPGDLAVSLSNSTLRQTPGATTRLSTFSAASGSELTFEIDRALVQRGTPVFEVAGAATLSADTRIAPVFRDVLTDSFNLRLISAGSLSLGGPVSAMLRSELPFLYQASLGTNAGNTAIDLSLRVKTAAELGLASYQAGSYSAVLGLLASNSEIGSAVSAITTAQDFSRAYTQLIPQSDGALLRVLETNATAAFGATARRLDLQTDRPDGRGAAWVEEFGVYHTSDASDQTPEISGGGFGVSAGYDFISRPNFVLGAFAALESIELEEQERRLSPLTLGQYSFGGYSGARFGAVSVNGAASVGFSEFSSTRRIEVGSFADTVTGDWNGTTFTGAMRATYTASLGPVDFKPYIGADVLTLQQDARSEISTGQFNNGVEADEGDSTLITASYGARLAGNWGRTDAVAINPELSIGYRNVLTFDSNPGMAQFNGVGTAFQLATGREPESALTAGFGFTLRSQFLKLNLGYDGEFADGATTHYGSIALRFSFW
ncbi:autotransporter domain-containing protein [bacterium]|nr:autotransporter domain-containing protein [bacterium]